MQPIAYTDRIILIYRMIQKQIILNSNVYNATIQAPICAKHYPVNIYHTFYNATIQAVHNQAKNIDALSNPYLSHIVQCTH